MKRKGKKGGRERERERERERQRETERETEREREREREREKREREKRERERETERERERQTDRDLLEVGPRESGIEGIALIFVQKRHNDLNFCLGHCGRLLISSAHAQPV